MAVCRCVAACSVKAAVKEWKSLSSARLGSEAQSCSEGGCSVGIILLEKAAALLVVCEQVEDRNGARLWRPPSGGLDPGHRASKHKEFHKEHNVAVRGSACQLRMLCGCICTVWHGFRAPAEPSHPPATSLFATPVRHASSGHESKKIPTHDLSHLSLIAPASDALSC